MENTAILYWIYNEKKHTNPLTEGYIGVTSGNLQGRLKTHWNSVTAETRVDVGKPKLIKYLCNENKDDIKIRPLTRKLPSELTYKLEEWFRPSRNIGWNGYKGGSGPSPKRSLIITTTDGVDHPFDSIAAAARAGFHRGNLKHVLCGDRTYFNFGCKARYA